MGVISLIRPTRGIAEVKWEFKSFGEWRNMPQDHLASACRKPQISGSNMQNSEHAPLSSCKEVDGTCTVGDLGKDYMNVTSLPYNVFIGRKYGGRKSGPSLAPRDRPSLSSRFGIETPPNNGKTLVLSVHCQVTETIILY